ncbi:Cytochrome b6-f complex iron-sulfur subunit [Streptomyces sp. ADI97-07]|uniref:Rieske (2Fe-2S) protein n=1 Tax=Streptomyces sp. ADI97-07 TaxID=1522762 RepID=UPI000F54D89C|nr:Rieske (2Fe-2S) protein [Streptomyces sp. ADI97-07]RPK74257.1 Cytochrome b6-f complex iron-sulfur subunit [Streptomyces sp. ADI97-07]
MSARRRTVLTAGAAALAAGCGSSDDGDGDGSTAPATAPETRKASETSAAELTRTSDVPVGGGTILKDRKVVVTQPEAGDFRAFSAVCTHAGCIVASVSDGTINCACHGSRFSITDAAVEAGPAPRPLPVERITVQGDGIRLG